MNNNDADFQNKYEVSFKISKFKSIYVYVLRNQIKNSWFTIL